ncbi:DUF2637 domain-containing protein [Rhodococcus sp. NPDC003994]
MNLAQRVALTGTVLIAAGSFFLSFSHLTNLAVRSGYSPSGAIIWPLVVDGLIVVATVAVVALRGARGYRYAWFLLGCGATVSIAANVAYPLLPPGPTPEAVQALVSLVPPVALLAVTHLTAILQRAPRPAAARIAPHTTAQLSPHAAPPAAAPTPQQAAQPDATEHPAPQPPAAPTDDAAAAPAADEAEAAAALAPVDLEPRDRARRLHQAGYAKRAIGRILDVDEKTVRRWLDTADTAA